MTPPGAVNATSSHPGTGLRWVLASLLGLAWTLSPLFVRRIEEAFSEGPSHLGLLAWTGGMLVLVGLAAIIGRRALRGVPWAGRALAVALVGLFGQLFLLGGSWLLLIYAEAAMILVCVFWFAVTGAFALSLERRLLLAAVGYFANFLIAARWPQHRYYLLADANLLLSVSVAWAWRSARKRASGAGKNEGPIR